MAQDTNHILKYNQEGTFLTGYYSNGNAIFPIYPEISYRLRRRNVGGACSITSILKKRTCRTAMLPADTGAAVYLQRMLY